MAKAQARTTAAKPPEPTPSGPKRKQGMSFESADGMRGGVAVFNSSHAAHVMYPIGITTTMIVNGRTVKDHKPMVEFFEGVYKTRDKEIARGMIEGSLFAGQVMPSIFLDLACVPHPLKDFYASLPVEFQREAALKLVDGFPADYILETLDPKAIDEAKKSLVAPPETITSEICPHSGCTSVFKGPITMARNSLSKHIQVAHSGKVE